MTRNEKQTLLADKYECMPEEMDRFNDDQIDIMYHIAFEPIELTAEEIEYGRKLAKKLAENPSFKPKTIIKRRLKH